MNRRSWAAIYGRLALDDGNAVIEFTFVAVLVLVPLVYLIVAVASVQRSDLAVTSAAREAGRAFATAESTDEAVVRARVATRLALAGQGLPDDAELRFVAPSDECDASQVVPVLEPGAEFAICVRRRTQLPGVPTILSGHGITTAGRFVVHIDDYRTVAQ